MEFERQEYFAQHIILSTTLTRLGAKIKGLTTAKEMWDVVKAEATTKSTLYILDAEEQLANMCYDFEQFRLYSHDCNSRFCIWVLKG